MDEKGETLPSDHACEFGDSLDRASSVDNVVAEDEGPSVDEVVAAGELSASEAIWSEGIDAETPVLTAPAR